MNRLREYVRKMAGTSISPPGVDLQEMLVSGLGGFVGIGLLALMESYLVAGTDLVLLIGSFGASAVLVYGAVKSPLAQPRNVLGGHLLSALVGVTAVHLLGPDIWLTPPLAVGASLILMHATRTLHPPGGATALIAVMGGPKIQQLGYLYVVVPVGAGAVLLLAVALLFNNLVPRRRYPEFWW